MWVFDGEEWTEEGGSLGDPSAKSERKHLEVRLPEPELQIVVEVVPATPIKKQAPPLPMP